MATSVGKAIRYDKQHSGCGERKRRNGNNSGFVLASGNIDILPYLQPSLVISLTKNNDYQLFINPHNIKKRMPIVKAKIDPRKLQFKKCDEIGRLSKQIISTNGLKKKGTRKLDVKCVNRRKCQVIYDKHVQEASRAFDIAYKINRINNTPHITLRSDTVFINKESLPKDFNIGIFIGPSGSGKTTSVMTMYGVPINKQVKWDKDRPVFSHFGNSKNYGDCLERFKAVGLAEKLGLSKFSDLSKGEQERAVIARCLGDGIIVDEFTSFCDRKTAKIVAKGVSEYIYKHGIKNVILIGCHYDIVGEDRLHPTFMVDMKSKTIVQFKPYSNKNKSNQSSNSDDQYSWSSNDNSNSNSNSNYNKNKSKDSGDNSNDGEGKESDDGVSLIDPNIDLEDLFVIPKIIIEMKRAHYKDWHPLFSVHHYKNKTISASARCFTGWASFHLDRKTKIENIKISKECQHLAVFTGILNQVGKKLADKSLDFQKREHRTVVLPDFQGLGMASRFCDGIGELLSIEGLRLQSKTAHPRYGKYRDRSLLWRPTGANHKKGQVNAWFSEDDDDPKENKSNSNSNSNSNNSSKHGSESPLPAKNTLDKLFYSHVYVMRNERNKKQWNIVKSRLIIKGMRYPYQYITHSTSDDNDEDDEDEDDDDNENANDNGNSNEKENANVNNDDDNDDDINIDNDNNENGVEEGEEGEEEEDDDLMMEAKKQNTRNNTLTQFW